MADMFIVEVYLKENQKFTKTFGSAQVGVLIQFLIETLNTINVSSVSISRNIQS